MGIGICSSKANLSKNFLQVPFTFKEPIDMYLLHVKPLFFSRVPSHSSCVLVSSGLQTLELTYSGKFRVQYRESDMFNKAIRFNELTLMAKLSG